MWNWFPWQPPTAEPKKVMTEVEGVSGSSLQEKAAWSPMLSPKVSSKSSAVTKPTTVYMTDSIIQSHVVRPPSTIHHHHATTSAASDALSAELIKSEPVPSTSSHHHQQHHHPLHAQHPLRKASSSIYSHASTSTAYARYLPEASRKHPASPVSTSVSANGTVAAAALSSAVSIDLEIEKNLMALLQPPPSLEDTAPESPPRPSSPLMTMVDRQDTRDPSSSSPLTPQKARAPSILSSSASIATASASAANLPAQTASSPSQHATNTHPSHTTTTQSTSASIRSTSSQAKAKPNYVLPTFSSQFKKMPSAPPATSTASVTSNTMVDKALQSLQQWISLKSDSPELSWKQQIKDRFARLIDDMKADPYGFAGKRIVIVGVHGWFPMKLVRSMIGEPTGTSVKFCEQMTAAVKHYFMTEHDLILSDECITCVPLEGEGKVEDRVDILYTNLINNSEWLEAVSSADIILWATHSQGTPVSVRLLHRLLERGHIHTHRQSVGLLAMAGIAHGPFPYLKGSLIVKYFEADAARELFEFMDSESEISQKFRNSLEYVLDRGIKMTLVASMQDQVVPLYSAIISAVQHPNILRSIYIDSHIYFDGDFVISLITFALKLRNAGLSDHGLLTHISDVLAGNLYAFEGGHSTIYEELRVYEIAVEHLLETLPLGRSTVIDAHHAVPAATKMHAFQAKAIKNPYCLPWAMRGICEDQRILQHPVWSKQLDRLRCLFEAWQPTNPKLHSIKLRLEPWTLTMI